jgi:putative ABC transport system ATP-binding protein
VMLQPVAILTTSCRVSFEPVADWRINQPEVLLADEPTSNLDEQTEREIMDLFRDIHARTGITIVLVTHTSQLVAYGTRALEMAGGVIVK